MFIWGESYVLRASYRPQIIDLRRSIIYVQTTDALYIDIILFTLLLYLSMLQFSSVIKRF